MRSSSSRTRDIASGDYRFDTEGLGRVREDAAPQADLWGLIAGEAAYNLGKLISL